MKKLDRFQQNDLIGDVSCCCTCNFFGCSDESAVAGVIGASLKKTQSLILILFIVLFGCRSDNQAAIDMLDANQDQNRIDLQITDIADISYIPLKYGAENIVVGTTSVTRNIFVSHDKIFLGDVFYQSPKLISYDFNGEPIHVFGSYGRGPGEYVNISGFIVDMPTDEVIIYDALQSKFVVFGTTGIFKREKFLEGGVKTNYSAIENINERYMLAYKEDSKVIGNEDIFSANGQLFMSKNNPVTWGKLFTLYDKQTLSEVDFLDFEYERPSRFQIYTILNNLTTTRDGVYVTSARTDTIYFMNRELELMPRFVDVTRYRDVNHEARLFPSAESEKYIFFSTALENNFDNQNLRRFFAYDKKSKKLLRINTGMPEQGVVNTWESLINNEVVFGNPTLTRNHNYAATLLPPLFLLEHFDSLPAELKDMTTQIREDDNPVLMLMKLR